MSEGTRIEGGRAVPAAILAGAVIIAAGLYFGLRARGAAPAAPGTSPSAALTPANAAARETSPALGGPGAPTSAVAVDKPVVPPVMPFAAPIPAAQDKNADLARAALEKMRGTLVAKCWAPAAAKSPEPAHASFTFNLAFDAQGKERARGIGEVAFGADARTDVGNCLRGLSGPIEIEPPGRPVSVTVTLELP